MQYQKIWNWFSEWRVESEDEENVPLRIFTLQPDCILQSFHKLIDGLAEVVDGLLVSGGHGIHHAVAHMILQDDFAGIVQCGADGSQLNQHIGAVLTVLHHLAHLLQMPDGPGQTVDDCLLVLVDMSVGMGNPMGVEIGVVMLVLMLVFMVMAVLVFVVMREAAFLHRDHLLKNIE